MACLRPPTLLLALTLAVPSVAALAAPSTAHACGGTFCDNLPEPMPVDQSGEDILFVSDGLNVEVHVRIQYTGEAERFAWVLPLQGIPEVAVGSDPLFTALSNATAPAWMSYDDYDCDEDDPDWGDDTGGIKLDAGGGTRGDGGPEVVFEEVVGAFEVVVLQGGTAAEVVDFLDANDYAQDPDAEPILQEYLDEGFLFAAVKLAADASVEEIHPLAFRFAGDEPCVPIRLTRIAAEDDMGIRAYFLGQDRYAPSNYAHVALNPLAYPWHNPGPQSYVELLSLAVDEAGGQAFVTEYAGSTDPVNTSIIYSPQWDPSAFIGVDPVTAIDLIGAQGLAVHPLIRALLLEFLPPPDGVDALEFWNNIEVYADQIDPMAWDADAFAQALSERVVEPGMNAVDLLDTWPTLTRLHTTMSPGEMSVDPIFHPNPDLGVLDNPTVETRKQVLCGASDAVYHVGLGGEDYPVCVPGAGAFPAFADMPAALRVEQIPMMGPPQVTTDNLAAIDAAYMSYDEGVECVADEGGTGTGDSGDGDSGDGDGSGDAGAEDGTETGPGYDLPYDVSCGCSTPAGGGAPVAIGLGLLVLGLLGPWRRRR